MYFYSNSWCGINDPFWYPRISSSYWTFHETLVRHIFIDILIFMHKSYFFNSENNFRTLSSLHLCGSKCTEVDFKLPVWCFYLNPLLLTCSPTKTWAPPKKHEVWTLSGIEWVGNKLYWSCFRIVFNIISKFILILLNFIGDQSFKIFHIE